VALGFDAGMLPARGGGEKWVREHTHVKVFDWGRSELNTVKKHAQLSGEDQRDRKNFWRNYVGGIDILAWEATRMYSHFFNNAGAWRKVTFTVVDFDSQTSHDFIGEVTVPVEEVADTTVSIAKQSTLTYSIRWCALPTGSRLAGVWKVHLVRANKLLAKDIGLRHRTSDPLCEVNAAGDGCFRRQESSIKKQTLDPEWNEVFELPVAAAAGHLESALEQRCPGFCKEVLLKGEQLGQLLPAEGEGFHEGPKEKTSAVKTGSFMRRWSLGGRGEPLDPQAYQQKWSARLDAAHRLTRSR